MDQRMLEKPQWNSSYHIQVVDDTHVVLVDETDYVVITGRMFPLVAKGLDGTRTFSELAGAVAQSVPLPELLFGLTKLWEQGYVLESGTEMAAETLAFWHGLNMDAGTVATRLSSSRVAVRSRGSVPAGRMVRALEPLVATTGLVARNGAQSFTLQIVLVDDYLDDRLAEVNRLALGSGQPWMPVKPVGRQVWLGPIFAPGITGCWECLAQRLRSNRQMEGFLQRRSGTSRPLVVSRAALAPYVDAALQLAASEAAKFIVSAALAARGGAVATRAPRTRETQHHVPPRRPQCRECGSAAGAQRPQDPVVFRSRPQANQADGGHRSVHPEVT